MFRRDYILRLIEQAAQAVARALKLMVQKKPEEAQQQLDSAYALLSLDRELLLALDANSLRSHVADPERREMAARILLSDAELQCEKAAARPALRRLRAARRLLETLDAPAPRDLQDELERITQRIDRSFPAP